jgi:polyribonucleotide nucleotidyltransferase
MIIREKVRVGDQLVTLETGRIAKQAGGSCLVRAGDTIVLVTVCGSQDTKPGQSFFPLSVDYQEKTYSAGKIPGGFFKREGRLRDYEILVSRLIDRPCRPLFPEGYLSEVQVIATVMSFDQVNPPDVLAMIGASAALHMSAIPWKGPIAGVRVGRVDGQFVANPTYEQLAKSDCDLIVAASRDAIVMVEGEAEEISEEDMIEALLFGHRAVQGTLELIDRMQQAVGKAKWRFNEASTPAQLTEQLRQSVGYKMREACNIADKHARSDRFKQIRKEAVELLAPEFPAQEELIKKAYEDLRYDTMRGQVLAEGRRLDGRDTRTVRPITIELGILPRVHGSSLFTRGETQAIVTSTLGTARDAQRLDTLSGDVHKQFLLHYNFPPYSVGEVKPMRGPGRREVGHGNLAERALAKMMPSKEEFPYTVRLVSEITESNGSSSMASVCGGALALMDAGVPIKFPVAGVAMGLIKEGEDYAVLTDILGDEDALGDMDFKVCGTEKGVTAIQMDIKVDGLSRDILERALHQAREARLHILEKMQRALPAPRPELSQYAPRITQIRVKPDQVRTIIGPGGKMIRAIVDQTGANIDVEDDGTVSVSSADSAAVQKALEIIKSLTTDPEIGEIYEGTVKRIEPYGAFIEILPGKDGLCHISDIDFTHVTSVEDYLSLGDKVTVKVTNIDRDGRIRLSRKDALADQPAAAAGARLNGRAEAREERGRDREERPREKREERGRGERGRAEREDRPRAKDLDAEERPAAKARDFEREERPAKSRDFDRDERPAKSRDLDREERPKARDFDREERPKARDFDREERPKARDFEREERPKARDFEREERPAKSRDFDRDERPRARDFERDERPAKSRDESRELRVVSRTRDFERDERPKARDFERDDLGAPSARPRDDGRREGARREGARLDEPRREGARLDEPRREPMRLEEPRREPMRLEERKERGGLERRDERPRLRDERPRDDERDALRSRPRDDERDERPARRPRDEGRDEPREREFGRARPEREPRPVAKQREPEAEGRPARRRESEFEAPAREREAVSGRTRAEREERGFRPRDDDREVARPRARDDEGPGRRRDEPRRELGEGERGARPRPRLDARSPSEDRFEPRPRRDVEGRGPAREPLDERPRTRDSEPPPRPVSRIGRFEDDRLYDEEAAEPRATARSDRGDRTERERPSRTRERARNRERVREAERERR